jgi:hypothetical protein
MAIPQQYLPTQQQQNLNRNPMLPNVPVTGDLDSEYLAEEAQLRQQVAQQYADILQQIGYTDPTSGQFIPGSVSVMAGRQAEDLQRQSDLAAEDVTNQAQQAGTLFSGVRARDIARAQQPYQTQIARLGVDTPIQIGGLYNQAAGLIDQYTMQNNLYLAAMAQRRAASIAQAALQSGYVGGSSQQQDQGGGGELAAGNENMGTNIYGGQNPPPSPGTTLPSSPTAPYTTNVTANKSGGSANKKQGIFSIH